MKHLSWLALALVLVGPAHADDETERLRSVLSAMLPTLAPDSIQPAPVKGFYEVMYGTQAFYLSSDGQYLLNGDLIEIASKTNLSEKRRGEARLRALEEMGEESMIVYPAKGEAKHTVTVFTDIDCGYCRKLHQGMKEMNELGITVRYVSFPRAGLDSASYRKAAVVWCSKDQRAAMDMAKLGGDPLGEASCDAPIREHMTLARQFDVRGTPAMVMDDGRMVPGYMPPDQLLKMLEKGG